METAPAIDGATEVPVTFGPGRTALAPLTKTMVPRQIERVQGSTCWTTVIGS